MASWGVPVAGTLAATVCLVSLHLAGVGASLDGRVPDLLTRLGFSSREISAVTRNSAVAKVLDTDSREIAVIGAVKIRASAAPLADRIRRLEYLAGRDAVRQLGRFGEPPAAADLEALRFEEYDLDVRDCRPGDCRVRLSDADIERFSREVDWRAPDWTARSARIWRDLLAGYARAYVERGPSALPVFVNKEDPLAVRDERALLMRQLRPMRDCAPELYDYAQNRPAQRPANAEEVTYWAVEDFRVRPVVRVVHQTLLAGADRSRPLAFISSQVYAAHYLDAAVSFSCVVAAPDEGDAFYLVSVNRARTRSLSGMLRALARSTVRNRTREGMEKILLWARQTLESQGSR